MTKARNLADLLNADGQIDNADIADNTISNAKLAQTPNFRNIIINGDMSIAQRGTSTASITSTGYYTVDRFQTVSSSSLGTWTQSQSTDVPTGQGFSSSLKMDCTTADASPAADDELRIRQYFEGQFLQYLKKGTANAESLTASFWVKSNKTGTYIAELMDNDNSYRHIGKSYTIDTADTWEKKTITFEGDTTGALDNNTGSALGISFWLGAGTTYTSGTLQTSWGSLTQANRAVGQVNLADNTANNFWITGVQLEAGTTASDFEFLPVDVNLQRCLRYYQTLDGDGSFVGSARLSTYIFAGHWFKVPMRATPSATPNQTISIVGDNTYTQSSTNLTYRGSNKSGRLQLSNFSGLTVGNAYVASNNAATDIISFDAEL